MSSSTDRLLSQPAVSLLSLVTYVDGSVSLIVGGKNGTLTLVAPRKGTSLKMLDKDLKVIGSWELKANGRAQGWLVQQDGSLQWFPPLPARQTPSARKRSQTHGKEG